MIFEILNNHHMRPTIVADAACIAHNWWSVDNPNVHFEGSPAGHGGLDVEIRKQPSWGCHANSVYQYLHI